MFRVKKIDPNIRVLMLPTVTIIGAIGLVMFLVNTGYPRIMTTMQESKISQTQNSVLQNKVDILQEFSQGVLKDRSGRTYTVLPDRNMGAMFLSQVKTYTTEEQIKVLTIDLKPSTPNPEKVVDDSEILMELEANDMASSVRFFQKLKDTAPISTLEEAKMEWNKENNKVEISLKTKVYWSKLPEKLPSLTEPLTEFSKEETDLLAIIENYKVPEFVSLSPETRRQDRVSPFN